MVKVKEDMTGWIMSEHGVFDSRIKVIKQAEDYVTSTGAHYAQWLCECMCENHTKFVVTGQDLRSGHTKSCGCRGKLSYISCSSCAYSLNVVVLSMLPPRLFIASFSSVFVPLRYVNFSAIVPIKLPPLE